MVLSKTLVFAASLVCISVVEAITATSVSTVPDLQRRADPIPTFTFRPVEKYLIKKVSCLLLPTIHILNALLGLQPRTQGRQASNLSGRHIR
jgi:hypothetical protein